MSLRGGATFFYYATLAATLVYLAVSAALARSRLGFFWRAIREDEDAARAMGVRAFPMKLLVVAISGGMTAIAGGFFGLINGSLFPETVLGMRASIDFIIGPIIGGLGSIFGPVVGALIVAVLNEGSKDVSQLMGVNGLNLFLYGMLLFVTIVALPDGVWPWVARRLGLAGPGAPR